MRYLTTLILFTFFIIHSGNIFANDFLKIKKLPTISSIDNHYFTVKPDLRKCISPICGGWVVNPVNQKVLKCPDGTVRTECYVGTDRIAIPDLSAAQLFQLRQAMSVSQILIKAQLSNAVDYGLLTINAAWLSASDQVPSGHFASVSNNGIVCITYPCPSFDATILNRKVVKSIAGYDLIRVIADKDQLAQADKEAQTDAGLHLAGRFILTSGPAGNDQIIEASQFYLKLVGDKPKMCAPTGCSGEICSDTAVPGTCEWRPEFECYRTAMCSSQKNGECGWEMDDALRSCLANTLIGNILSTNGVR